MVRENKREDILKAAIKIFAEKSYNGTSTSEIAKEAGVAEGTIFRYFNTKKALLRGVMDKFTMFVGNKLINDRVGKILDENKDKDEKEILKLILIDRIDLIKKYKDIMKVVFTEMHFTPEIKENIVKNIVPKVKVVIERYIRIGIERGSFRAVNIDAAVTTLVGTLTAYIIYNLVLFEGLHESNDDQLDNLIDIAINGLKK